MAFDENVCSIEAHKLVLKRARRSSSSSKEKRRRVCLCKEIYGFAVVHMPCVVFLVMASKSSRGALVMSASSRSSISPCVVILLSSLLTFIRLLLTGQTDKFPAIVWWRLFLADFLCWWHEIEATASVTVWIQLKTKKTLMGSSSSTQFIH